MIYNFILVLTVTLGTISLDAQAINMKSKLSANGELIMIQLELSETDVVGFELIEPKGDVVFIWNEQELPRGYHELQLERPTSKQGKYLLRLNTKTKYIDHLIFFQ